MRRPSLFKHSSTRQKKSPLREWIESIIIAFILAMFIRTFFIQAFKIPTGSMRPTLMPGDRILVNKFIYGAKIPFTKFRLPKLRSPQRGEVIVFIYPKNPRKDFIKRLIGLGGETIEIRDGQIYINDELVEDERILKRYYYNRGVFGAEGEKIKIPKGFYYVLGDNSSSSQDSRYWGFVPEENLIGKAFFIFWPPSRIGLIK
jgi:signal peptidase I